MDVVVTLVLGLAGLVMIVQSISFFRYGVSTYWHAKRFRYWTFRRGYNLLAVSVTAFAGIFLGVALSWHRLMPAAYVAYGICLLLMLFVPCSIPAFNTKRSLKALRTAFFIAAGIGFIANGLTYG